MSAVIVLDTVIAGVSALASVMIAYLRWSSMSEEKFASRVEQIMDKYMHDKVREEIKRELQSDDTRRMIEDAIDRSQLNKNVQRLIVVLCANDDDLRRTSVCQGM